MMFDGPMNSAGVLDDHQRVFAKNSVCVRGTRMLSRVLLFLMVIVRSSFGAST